MKTGFDTTWVMSVWRGETLPDLLPNGFVCWWRGHQFRHAPGGFTDGLSSPQFLHLASDMDARGWAYPAAVLHDGGYHDDLEMLHDDGTWQKFTLSKDDCDTLFKELMAPLADTPAKQAEAEAFYQAVHLFGQSAFDQGRNNPPSPLLSPPGEGEAQPGGAR